MTGTLRYFPSCETCKVDGVLLRWIKDFLSKRSQAVVIHGQDSKPLPVSAGAPRGSVLGPMLFLVFLSDLGKDISTNIDFYAGDTTLHQVIKTKTERVTGRLKL